VQQSFWNLPCTKHRQNSRHRGTQIETPPPDTHRRIVEFDRRHAPDRFDGIHLDVEPQQRPENRGPSNLRFLPGLVDAFRAVRAVAASAGIRVNADIQNKLFRGDFGERKMLLTSVPRVTLMMYDLSSPKDGESFEQKAEKVEKNSQRYLDMAYNGLGDGNLAKMVVALCTPDYGQVLPQMLMSLDEANRANSHHLGWARHSYNDYSKKTY
jgi:hypothetical protein